MPGPIASKLSLRAFLPRAGARLGLAAAVLLLGSQSLQNAVANGDTRTITMRHLHTKETITVTFKRDGRYDQAVLEKLNWFLRDWRHDTKVRMDPRLIDLVWEVNREVGGTKPIAIICGYRDESTNAMLRRRSNGVAKKSLHMSGKAIDFAIPGVPLSKLRVVGLQLQRGGVGFYPSSGSPFVHMDIGGVRHWPRMSRRQLERVFPNGRTVHIPRDGKPLAGYALALADIERRGSAPSEMSIASARKSGIDTDAVTQATDAAPTRGRSLIASLFGTEDAAKETKPETRPETKPAAAPAPVRMAAAPPTVPARPVPVPKVRPVTAPVVVAMAQPKPPSATGETAAESVSPIAKPEPEPQATVVASASPTPRDVIHTRGYWVGVPDMHPAAPAADSFAARMAGLGDAPVTTGSIPLTRLQSAMTEVGSRLLAYAPLPERHAAAVPKPRRSVVIRSTETATSVAVKAGRGPTMLPVQTFNPWLTAVAIAPSVWTYLSATQYGVRDSRKLRPYLRKPSTTVAMTFSNDPHHGLSAAHFGGRAVVFVNTLRLAAHKPADPRRTARLAFTAAP